MKILTLIFFHGYVWALIVFGGMGVVTAKLEQGILFRLPVDKLEAQSAASMLSQYRFFRAVECGFGIFAFTCRKEIFEKRLFNRLFLGTMLGGVAARCLSLLLDGNPYPVFYGFLVFELIGGILIYIYSRRTVSPEGS